MSDRIFGIVSLVVIAIYAYGISLTQESFMPQPVGPKVMPYILCGLGVICALYFIIRPDPEPSWPARSGWLEILAAILVMFVYAHALPVLGFVAASALATAYFVWRFGGSWLQSLLAGVIIAAAIYLVFHQLLGLSLAKGPWGF